MLIKKSPFLSLTRFAVVSLTLLLAIGCQDEAKKTESKGGDNANANLAANQSGFQMNCVKMTKAQVQAWVDSGWTNPANPSNEIKKILLQFYSGDAQGSGTNMQLIAYPAKNFVNVYIGGRQTLEIDTTCTAMTPSGAMILANNYVNIKPLKIVKADGTLEDFTFLRFRPISTYAPYINFEVEVVRVAGLQEQILFKGGGSDPCPPYCPNEGDGD